MGNGHGEIEHNQEIVSRLLNGLDLVANDLIVEPLSAESELPANFMSAVLKAENELEEMISSLTDYQELFKNDIARIRKASEEIVSHEKQIAYKMSAALESAISVRKSK
ncbi:TPA: hypothetical protein ACSK9V_001268 [Listeria innocua]|nr:hypothetical protein [Listeria innocua]EAH4440504.1 hypothetical protein [Listeria innocua]HBM3530881.1 hypothetical protein [Listeria innocua]HBM3577036.1 hypothetical protein [Listeria innocua]HBM3725390.1 hypothetical protein [Listeria innocua]